MASVGLPDMWVIDLLGKLGAPRLSTFILDAKSLLKYSRDCLNPSVSVQPRAFSS